MVFFMLFSECQAIAVKNIEPESLNVKAKNSRKSANPELFRRSLFTFAIPANPVLSLGQFFNVNELLKTI